MGWGECGGASSTTEPKDEHLGVIWACWVLRRLCRGGCLLSRGVQEPAVGGNGDGEGMPGTLTDVTEGTW